MRKLGALVAVGAMVLGACGGQIEESPPLVAPPTRTPVPATHTPAAEDYAAYLAVETLTEEVRAFLEAAEAASALERSVLFEQKVLAARPACFDGDYLTPDAGAILMRELHLTLLSLETWRAALEAFPASALQSGVEDTFARAAALLPPQGALRVCLFPAPPRQRPQDAPHHGLDVRVWGRELLFVACAGGELCLEALPPQLAYAYHYAQQLHLAPRTVEDMTLLEFAIYNARATDFALTLYPEARFPWTVTIAPEDEAEVWAALQRYADVTQGETVEARQLDRVLYGKNTSRYPDWGGMIVGWHIVQAFRANHPDVTLSELAAMPAAEVVARSGYAPPAP